MEKQIYHIEPLFEAKYWGGQALKERYGYNPDLPNIAIAYHVIALPQHNLDNEVVGTGETLSRFYKNNPELFCCEREEFPIRMGSGNKVKQISVQLHPNDEYCLEHEGERGKVECGIIVQGDRDHLAIRGHNAKTREEFREMVENGEWQKLFRVVEIKKGQYNYGPQGMIHGSPTAPTEDEMDMIELGFETNSDITYRLYDWDRDMPDRPLHVEKVIETVNIPDDDNYGFDITTTQKDGCNISYFLDKPGIFTAFRLQVEEEGRFERPEFMFLFCIDGEGTVNDVAIKKGETIFIPCHFGELTIKGKLDLGGMTYRNRDQGVAD